MASALPGFVRGLFAGRIEPAALLPFPHQEPEAAETTDAIVAAVREWAEQAIDPEAIDHAKEIPPSVLAGLRELGLFGLTIPEEYGGAGQGQVTYARVMETVAHRCASTVTVLGGQLGIGMKAILLYGTAEQRERFLPPLARGERIAAFALTEAGAGSDAAALATRALPQPDGSWKLSGRKIWITNGGFAGGFTVFARTPDPARPDAPPAQWPISCFWVERERPGVSTGRPEDKMGLCGSSTTEVALEDVVVPALNLLGPRGDGFKVALNVLNSGRHGLAACCIGQARLARDLAHAHAKERVQFGRAIGSFGMVQELLAGMDADLYAMRATTYLTAGLMDAKQRETMLEAACCKMYATERLWQIANDALQVTGGTGFMREYPYERILRDARINMIFEGTNQVLRMMIAYQGLRSLSRGEIASSVGTTMAGVHERFAPERAELERQVPLFAARCRAALATHGEAVRDAQFTLHRLADMVAALFAQAAALSLATSSEARGTAGEHERDLARLACHRASLDFERALREEERPADALVERVASADRE